MTTRVGTDGIADDAVTAAKIAAGAVGTTEIAAGSVTAVKIATGAVPLVLGVRQTVHGGPTSSGAPNFFPAATYSPTVTALSITTSGLTTDPLVVSASQGFGSGCERIGSSSAELTWTSLTASQTCYLYVDVGADGTLTTGHAIVAPVYSYTASTGTNTFNITTMTMYTSGTTKGWRVFVGEAVTGVSAVTSVVMYAYNGRFTGYASAAAPLVLTALSVEHKLGVVPLVSRLRAECVTTQAGFAVGDVVTPVHLASATYLAVQPLVSATRLKTRALTNWYHPDPASGTSTVLTVGSWKMWFEADRGW